tara:strand:+ start:1987 stop:2175 length:189 start_codon:yes stop_codon:yes gene_type:complete
MKVLGAVLVVGFGFWGIGSPSYSHLYDTVGVLAGDHVHDAPSSEGEFENNCFVDPKLGPICK